MRSVGTEILFGSHRSCKPLIGQRLWEYEESHIPTGKLPVGTSLVGSAEVWLENKKHGLALGL